MRKGAKMAAFHIASALTSGDKAQREAAYEELTSLAATAQQQHEEGGDVASVLAASVAPLVEGVLTAELVQVDVDEFQRASLVLAEMFFAEPLAVGAEYMREQRFTKPWTAKVQTISLAPSLFPHHTAGAGRPQVVTLML